MNIGEIAQRALAFRKHLDEVKASLGPQRFEWYRYDSLANLAHLDVLLTGDRRNLLDLAEGRPVLDVGCADGDFAFFLESLGCEVVAVDYPGTNHNTMAGVHALKAALGSKIEILAMDVDSHFALPGRDFGLAFVLGILYHLKNPFYVLETVSRHSRHCVMSTRLARLMPGIPGSVKDVAVAYLLGADELNADNSNYWIFTEASFRQMLRRTNWHVEDLVSLGDLETSDPVTTERDERVFCLAESRYALANVELLDGWHEAEERGWRWTKKEFGVRCRVPVGLSRAMLRMSFYLPDSIAERRLGVWIDGVEAVAETMRGSGFHDFVRDLGTADGRAVVVRMELDAVMPGDGVDDRERGVIVHTMEVV